MLGKAGGRTAATAAALLLATAAVLANGSPAFATDTSFDVAYAHAGGAGATAAATKGSIRWLNRSVALDNVQIYCGQDHFVDARFIAFQNDNQIGTPLRLSFNCVTFPAQWSPFGDHVLDGSDVPGGINRVIVQAVDVSHGGVAEQRRNR
jgi:hypothetical protein